MVWAFWKTEKSLTSAENRAPYRPAHNLVKYNDYAISAQPGSPP